MKDRLRVKINHHLVSYNSIALFLIILSLPIFLVTATDNAYSLTAYIIFTFLTVALALLLSSLNSWLTADSKSLQIRYLKHQKTIYLSDIKEYSYGLYREYSERTYRVQLYITTFDGEVHTFNDRIDLEKLTCALDTPMDTDIPIIKIYRFLEKRLPDKAKGYIE